MKIFIGIISSLLIWIASFQGIQKTTFKVFGNCTECKERIEQALDVKGVQIANWNIDSKQLFIKYDPEKISLEQIHSLIAAVGHDTDKMKAPDSVYVKLPECCLFRNGDNTHHD